jgi:crotonobetainyl-CoA:carnitine CoA-transferase CaiB-like acyl-CoA transferase
MKSAQSRVVPAELSAPNGGALSGLVVADFSRVLAGPFATQSLSDMGATVIKVESPEGDETRSWLPPERDGVSTYYLGINRNKRSITLNFGDEEDRALALEIASRADIFVENFKPGGLKKFGLDYESVKAVNPSIIYASISGFGEEGGAKLPGYDLTVQATSGLMSLTGEAGGATYRSGVSVFDIMTGMQATVGILAALHHREMTGEGQRISVNLLSTALAAMANHSSTYLAAGQVPSRMGNAHPSLFPYEPLPAKDGEIIIVAANNSQFGALCRTLGTPELLEDSRFETVEKRNRNREALRPLLVAALATKTKQEWFEELSAAGVACGPINSIADGFKLAEELGLRPVVEVGEGTAKIPVVRSPITFSATPAQYYSKPPSIGEHGALIREWLKEKN